MQRKPLLSFVIIFLFSAFGLLLGADLFAKEKHKKNPSREALLISHIKHSIEAADKNPLSLSSSVLHLEGMSCSKVRCLLNHLCALPNTSYLEIGCWKGSSLVAALYKNESTVIDAIAIDNWSEYGGPKAEFLHTINTFLPNAHLRFYEKDCFQLEKEEVFQNPVTIFFYDGNHSLESQEMAFSYFNAIFDDLFIALVNEWNLPQVQLGTQKAFNKLGYEILYEKNLSANFCSNCSTGSDGFYIALIKKKSCNCL
jgi:hypothetical protein